MEKYRIHLFKTNGTDENFYFKCRDDAIIWGTKQLFNTDTKHVFLLKMITKNTYDVDMEIK